MEATLRAQPGQGPIDYRDPRHPRQAHRSYRLVDLHPQNRIRSWASHEALDMNHRILPRPHTFAIAVDCSATQGHAKQRSYIFVYTWPSINGCGLSVVRDVVVAVTFRVDDVSEIRL